MSPKLGYRIDLEQRDLIASRSTPFGLAMRGDEPDEIDVRSWWQIRNQANQGSCRGHSLAANARYCARAADGELDLDRDGRADERQDDDFSPQWCYIQSQKTDGINGDKGATISGGIPVGLEQGIARESIWPYTGRYATRAPRFAADDAKAFRFKRYTQFERGDVATMKAWLATGQGGIDWGKSWPLPFLGGCLVDGGINDSQSRGGHATGILGYIRAATLLRERPDLSRYLRDESQILFIGVNSHGTNAQDRGFYYLTARGLQACSEHRYTEAIGWSDLTTPRPRVVDFRNDSLIG